MHDQADVAGLPDMIKRNADATFQCCRWKFAPDREWQIGPKCVQRLAHGGGLAKMPQAMSTNGEQQASHDLFVGACRR